MNKETNLRLNVRGKSIPLHNIWWDCAARFFKTLTLFQET